MSCLFILVGYSFGNCTHICTQTTHTIHTVGSCKHICRRRRAFWYLPKCGASWRTSSSSSISMLAVRIRHAVFFLSNDLAPAGWCRCSSTRSSPGSVWILSRLALQQQQQSAKCQHICRTVSHLAEQGWTRSNDIDCRGSYWTEEQTVHGLLHKRSYSNIIHSLISRRCTYAAIGHTCS